jgi:hypothetical protein
MHGHLLQGYVASLCVDRDCPLTISHILSECLHYDKDWLTFNLQDTVYHIPDCSKVSNIVAFLHSTRLAELSWAIAGLLLP